MGNIFGSEDELSAFISTIYLWISKIERGNYSEFETSKPIIDEQCVEIKAELQQNIIHSLQQLKNEFNCYIPECEENKTSNRPIQKLIHNPFIVNVSEVPDEFQEVVIEQQHDSSYKDTSESGIKLEDLWCLKAISFPKIPEIALSYLTLFSTTYVCEQGFSALLIIQNKQRHHLNISDDIRLDLSTTKPRIQQLVRQMQAQKSH